MFDLTTLDISAASESGVTMYVRHLVTGEVLTGDDGNKISIVLAGKDSERYRRSVRAYVDRRIEALENGRRISVKSEDMDNEKLESVVACTISWSGVGMKGSLLECTPENARALYKQLPWLLSQADTFIEDRSRFLKASPTI